jgi:hypothetical protein
MCEWFLLCDNEPVGVVRHVVLGDVPTCQRCADKLDLSFVMEELTAEELVAEHQGHGYSMGADNDPVLNEVAWDDLTPEQQAKVPHLRPQV